MRHLYRTIYVTILASLVLVVVTASAFWRFMAETTPASRTFEMASELVAAALPPADTPREVQQEAIARLAERLETDLTLFDRTLTPIAVSGEPLPPPRGRGGWMHRRGGPAWSFHLPDGRWLVARSPMRHRPSVLSFLALLGGIALVVAICAYPVVRWLTRRLERLQESVEILGAGNLAARVKVEGRDEVARLAESFNRAAARIAELVAAHRMLLANASHELRTPLSRIRLGVELLYEHKDPQRKAALERDIAELDMLIDDILLASRLGALATLGPTEDVDLLGLAAEECARYDTCTLEGTSAMVRGDPRLLRRLVRNLLDNAERHGKPPIRMELSEESGLAVLEVVDQGEGIPEAERERVFTPFHRLAGDSRGAGLGLALVRQIARLHGGEAAVAPRPAEPSCIRVSLPAVKAQSA